MPHEMRGIILPLAAAALLPGVLAAELRGSGLGLTEALAGQDSAGAQAVYSVGVLLDGDPLASLGAVPTYADCATACRLNGECTSFAFCGAEVRQSSTLAPQSIAAAACAGRRLAHVSRLNPGPAIGAGWLPDAGQRNPWFSGVPAADSCGVQAGARR